MIDAQIGPYRVVDRIGADAHGVLYKAIDQKSCRDVALKILSGALDPCNSDVRARFVRGARAASKLRHRNIVTVLDCGEHDGAPYLVMEFVRGQTLAARARVTPSLTLEQKLDAIAELCAGLQFAHEYGIVHRNVKPSNVLRLDDGTVKLLDFGMARVSRSTLTKQGDVLGSVPYLAPEQAQGKPVDRRADIFSSGVVLYELLTGRSPFEAESPIQTVLKITSETPLPVSSMVKDIPDALSAALETALQKNPSDRYQYAADFRADLQLVKMSLETPIAC
jgi:serine/threonine protein kinase